MENSKTRVVNKTKLVVSLTGCSEEIRLGGGGTTIFPSGKLCKKNICSSGKLCKNQCDELGRCYVRCCEQVLAVLKVDDFQNNMGKDLLLDVLDNYFVYAFVHPMSNTNNICWIRGHPCNLGELMVDDRIWREKGFRRGNMKNLETVVVNNTELQLSFIDWYEGESWSAGEFPGEDVRVPSYWRKKICSGNFARAMEKRPSRYHRIGVWSGQHLLAELTNHQFQKNKGKDLVFHLVDDSLLYSFVYPTAAISCPCKLPLPLPLPQLKQLDRRQVHDQECETFKTRVVNKTDFPLTLIDYLKFDSSRDRDPCRDRYGDVEITVRKGGAKTICSGHFFKREKWHDLFYRRIWREIHVLRDGQLMLVLNSHHFHNTQGKHLILDDMANQHTLTFVFLRPTQSQLTYF